MREQTICPNCGSDDAIHTPNGGSELIVDCCDCDCVSIEYEDDIDDTDDGPLFESSARHRTRPRREYGE